MNKEAQTITVTLDGNVLETERGLTILQIAKRHDTYIPTLCAHKDLAPFGACRMCIVEVKGMRGFPAACTTPVEPGMEIKTDSPEIHAARLDILKLILSEHTSSCLICDERHECRAQMGTIRKVGVTTGCRYCPSDGQCDLQEVVERMGVEELDFPVTYRGLPVGKDDPFIERDYNLCILCGRCVRVCHEVRRANTLTFCERGPETVVGTAYGRSHVDAGCEFCGECVSVCPTGALSEKARKWEGVAEREVITTCPLCGVGCQTRLQVKGDKVIGSLPAEDPVVSNAQLCVKGRFYLPELLDNHRRLVKPIVIREGRKLEISMDEAIDLAAKKIERCVGDDAAMMVSANSTNEDLYVAQKFARMVMGSNNIDTDTRGLFGDGFNPYVELMKMPGALDDLRRASTILCVGLDTRFAQSIVNVELHNAADRGARIVTLNSREHNLTIMADLWVKPAPGTENRFFATLLAATNGGNSASADRSTDATSKTRSTRKAPSALAQVPRVAAMLKEAENPVIVVGSDVLQREATPQILESIKELAENIDARVVLLPPQNNLYGSLLMGAYRELLPGGLSSSSEEAVERVGTSWGVDLSKVCAGFRTGEAGKAGKAGAVRSRKKKRVVYVVGDVPVNGTPKTDFLIYQNIYPADPGVDADLVFPSAAFSEGDGTYINGEGRVQEVRMAVNPPGEAIPDWEILCRIAQKMGKSGFDFTTVDEIRNEIADLADRFRDFDPVRREAAPLELECENVFAVPPSRMARRRKGYPFILNTSVGCHTYMGFPLSMWVDGSKDLFVEGVVDVNPVDAESVNIADNDEVLVTSPRFERTVRARIVGEQPKGTLHVALNRSDAAPQRALPANIRKKDV